MRYPVHALIASAAMLAGTSLAGQFHAPFHADSRKVYMDLSGLGRVYSLAFDSATTDGNDSLFHHFGRLNDTSTFVSSWCPGWGSPYCLPTDIPEWSGGLFRTDGPGTYLLQNLAGDTLRLELDIAPGDTSIFYQRDDERFALVREDHDTLTVIGVQDSVITYRILHTDTLGTPIASALQQQPLRVGKALGLTHFFQVDSFPQVLRPLEMVGNKGPDAGLHQITNAMIHDHQPGDVIQRKLYSNNFGGVPWNNWDIYSKVTFLSRTDTPDSIIYQISISYFNVDDSTTSMQQDVARHHRHSVIAEIPFEQFYFAYYRSLVGVFECGIRSLTYQTVHSQYLAWCPQDACWTNYDTNGPAPDDIKRWTLGLGDPEFENAIWAPAPVGHVTRSTIVYYLKDGIPCGSEQFLGIGDAARISVRAYPNPTTGVVRLEGMDPRSISRVFDALGRPVAVEVATDGTLDLSTRADGLYFVEGLTNSGERARVRVVVAR